MPERIQLKHAQRTRNSNVEPGRLRRKGLALEQQFKALMVLVLSLLFHFRNVRKDFFAIITRIKGAIIGKLILDDSAVIRTARAGLLLRFILLHREQVFKCQGLSG